MCRHAPEPLFDKPLVAATALLRYARAGDWRRCRLCGMVGLTARHSRRVHSWMERPELTQRARNYNEWNTRLAAEQKPNT